MPNYDYTAAGNRGVDIAENILRPHCQHIIKVSVDTEYTRQLQINGGDLLLILENGHLRSVEVKTVQQDYQAMFLEVAKGDQPGWARLIKSDLLVWTYISSRRCYLIDYLAFWTEFLPRLENYPLGYSRDTKQSQGRIIPWKDILLTLAPWEFQAICLDSDYTYSGHLDLLVLS